MPQVLLALPDVYESVIRRCAIDSVNQLARTMRLPPDTHILLPGTAEAMPMNQGDYFLANNDPGILYPSDGRLMVSVTEEIDESTTLSQHVGTQENLPLFSDPIRQLIFFPIYRQVTMNLNIEYVAPNQTSARRWLDEMRSRIVQLRAELYQTLEYHYAIPDAAMVLIHEVWQKIEASSQPTGLTFKDYLDHYLARPTKTGETLAGTHPRRLIVEKQMEVLGWFDFTSTPQTPEKASQDDGSYTSSFTFSLVYDRPTQLLCRYPLVIHNTPIKSEFIPKEPYYTFRQYDRRVSFLKGSLESFLNDIQQKHIPYLVYPEVDDWSPDTLGSPELIFFSGLLVLDKDQPRRLVDLAELGPHTFTPYFLEYFYQQQHTLFNTDTSPFVFKLYEGQTYRNDVTFSFQAGSLVLQTDRDLDMTRMYHIQLGLARDWGRLSGDTVQCLRRYPVVTYTLFRILGVNLGNAAVYNDLRLLASSSPRIPSTACPGQGSITTPPGAGGVWPWPWLGDDYANDPWPGYDFDYTDTKWPGGQAAGDSDIPYWSKDPMLPGNGSGVIRDSDMQDAIDKTEGNPYGGLPQGSTSPLTTLYLNVLTFKGRT